MFTENIEEKMNQKYSNRRFSPSPIPKVKVYDAKLPNPGAGSNNEWIILEINNTNDVQATARLFDASGLAAIKEGKVNANGIIITGISTPYPGLLNDLASGEQIIIDYTKIRVKKGDERQFENPWYIFEDKSRSNSVNLENTVFPSVFEHSTQQQENLLEVMKAFLITRKSTLEFVMEPETKMIMRFCLGVVLQNG